MKITQAQYNQKASYMPRQRGNVSVSNLQVLNAILYVAESGCRWRGLPKHFGNWHTIYTRMNRWAKSGALNRIFEQLQKQRIIRIRIEFFSENGITMNTDTGHQRINTPQILLADTANSQLEPLSKFIWLPRMLQQF